MREFLVLASIGEAHKDIRSGLRPAFLDAA
jgi:hypothetical protein